MIMERIGTIGERRLRLPRLFKILSSLLLISVLLLFFNHRLHRTAAVMGESELSFFFSSAVTHTLASELKEKETSYRDFVTLTYKADGDVSTLETDMPLLLSLQTTVCDAVFETYRRAGRLELTIPLSLLLGLDFLPISGPNIRIEALPTRFLHTYYTSEFHEAGINQTRHRIVFHVEGTFTLIFPAGEETVTVRESYCVAETLIAGRVPDAYTEITRLSEEILESDIDDIFDFGAQTD